MVLVLRGKVWQFYNYTQVCMCTHAHVCMYLRLQTHYAAKGELELLIFLPPSPKYASFTPIILCTLGKHSSHRIAYIVRLKGLLYNDEFYYM